MRCSKLRLVSILNLHLCSFNECLKKINRLSKEINGLLNKGMFLIQLKNKWVKTINKKIIK